MKRLMHLRSIILYSFLIGTLFCVACTSNSIVFNELSGLNEGAAPFIEGSYSETIDQDAFKEITGINILDCLPEAYKNYAISAFVQYIRMEKLLTLCQALVKTTMVVPSA